MSSNLVASTQKLCHRNLRTSFVLTNTAESREHIRRPCSEFKQKSYRDVSCSDFYCFLQNVAVNCSLCSRKKVNVWCLEIGADLRKTLSDWAIYRKNVETLLDTDHNFAHRWNLKVRQTTLFNKTKNALNHSTIKHLEKVRIYTISGEK